MITSNSFFLWCLALSFSANFCGISYHYLYVSFCLPVWKLIPGQFFIEFNGLQEEEETKPILASNDPREIQKFYQIFYEKNIREGQYTKKP